MDIPRDRLERIRFAVVEFLRHAEQVIAGDRGFSESYNRIMNHPTKETVLKIDLVFNSVEEQQCYVGADPQYGEFAQLLTIKANERLPPRVNSVFYTLERDFEDPPEAILTFISKPRTTPLALVPAIEAVSAISAASENTWDKNDRIWLRALRIKTD